MGFRIGAIVGGTAWDALSKLAESTRVQEQTGDGAATNGAPRLCKRKVCHPSEGAAWASARSLIRREKADANQVRVYRCPRCQAFHTTTEEKRNGG